MERHMVSSLNMSEQMSREFDAANVNTELPN